MKCIHDLQYRAVRIPSIWTRGGYALVFYRHDRDGAAFLDDIHTDYGNDLRAVRSRLLRHGRDIVTNKVGRGFRTTYVTVDARKPIKDAMPFLLDENGHIRGAK